MKKLGHRGQYFFEEFTREIAPTPRELVDGGDVEVEDEVGVGDAEVRAREHVDSDAAPIELAALAPDLVSALRVEAREKVLERRVTGVLPVVLHAVPLEHSTGGKSARLGFGRKQDMGARE